MNIGWNLLAVEQSPGNQLTYSRQNKQWQFRTELKRSIWSTRASIIRTMQMQKTPHFFPTKLSELPQEHSDWTFKGGKWDTFHGVPMPIIIRECNAVGVQPWVQVPHSLSINDQHAFVKSIIDSSQKKPIVGYSNEFWNTAHYPYNRMMQDFRLGTFDELIAHYARSLSRLKQAFGPSIQVSLEAQSNNPWVANRILELTTTKPDILAIGAYFGHDMRRIANLFISDHDVKSLNFESMLGSMELWGLLSADLSIRLTDRVKRHKALADKYGLIPMTYEAGQHLVHQESAKGYETDQYIKMNQDNRMGGLIFDMLRILQRHKYHTTVLYGLIGKPSHFGSWGFRQNWGIPDKRLDAKYLAVVRWLQKTTY